MRPYLEYTFEPKFQSKCRREHFKTTTHNLGGVIFHDQFWLPHLRMFSWEEDREVNGLTCVESQTFWKEWGKMRIYFFFVLGRSYVRLDSITFHWRCPSDRLSPDRVQPLDNAIFDYDDKETVTIVKPNFQSSKSCHSHHLSIFNLIAVSLFGALLSNILWLK